MSFIVCNTIECIIIFLFILSFLSFNLYKLRNRQPSERPQAASHHTIIVIPEKTEVTSILSEGLPMERLSKVLPVYQYVIHKHKQYVKKIRRFCKYHIEFYSD